MLNCARLRRCTYTIFFVLFCRRAELREADKLLMETELDLKDAQQEAAKVIQQFDDATHGLQVHIRSHKYYSTRHQSMYHTSYFVFQSSRRLATLKRSNVARVMQASGY